MLHLSMDGPSVSRKVFRLLCEGRESNGYPSLVHIGSCGLHIIHGSFQMGAKEGGWDIEVLLKALWNIFRDSPARRADYERVADSVVFPLKFCSHRWVEDEQVAERALQLRPNVLKMLQVWQSLAPSKRLSCKSYGTLIDTHRDHLISIKLRFFKSVAAKLKAFLMEFQTDFPMLPFLA